MVPKREEVTQESVLPAWLPCVLVFIKLSFNKL